MKTSPLYLNGGWVRTQTTLRVVNPATAEPFAEVCTGDRKMVAQAVTDAHAAFPSWRKLPAKARGDYLRKVAGEL